MQRRLSTKAREKLYDRWRGRAAYPICNLCSLPIFPGQRWDESHEKHKPKWLGGKIEGLAHHRCNQKHNNDHDTPLYHKTRRQRQKHIGAWQSRWRPIMGSIASGWRRFMDGRVERR